MASFKVSIEQLPQMLRWIEEEMREQGVAKETRRQLELALEEALVNIISHGKHPSKDALEIECKKPIADQVVFIIKDSGIPFNPLQKLAHAVAGRKAQLEPLEDATVGGRGILLMHQCVDEIQYKHIPPCNILTLIKKL